MHLLNYDQVANLLSVKKTTLYSLVSRGRIPFVRISGRMVRFINDEIINWIESKRINRLEDSTCSDHKQ